MIKSLKDYKPTDTYYIKVDLMSVYTYTTESGMEFYHPDNAGDTYQNKPFHGELITAPKNSRIPVGATVYLNYLASDTLVRTEEGDYYVVKKDMIVAYEVDNVVYAFESVLINVEKVKKEKLVFDTSVDELVDATMNGSQRKSPPTTKAEVIAADLEWMKSNYNFTLEPGDVIEYEAGLDWGYFVNRKEKYYIKWADRIIKKNNQLVNRYNEIVPIPKYKEVYGVVVTNDQRFTKVVDGEFSGKDVLPDTRKIETGKYLKSQFIYGHLEE